MNKKNIFFFIGLLCLVLVGCSNGKKEETKPVTEGVSISNQEKTSNSSEKQPADLETIFVVKQGIVKNKSIADGAIAYTVSDVSYRELKEALELAINKLGAQEKVKTDLAHTFSYIGTYEGKKELTVSITPMGEQDFQVSITN